MREIRVTGGYNDPLVTDVASLQAEGLTVKGALVAEDAPWPASDASVWTELEAEDTPGGVTVSQLVTATTAPGHYHWWLQLAVGGMLLLLRVRDPDDPDQPWLIYVH